MQFGQFDTGIAGLALQRSHDRLGRGLTGALSKRRQSSIDHIDTGLDRFQISHIAHTAGKMGMDIDRHGKLRFERPHQLFGIIRRQQTGHILDTDRIGAHLHQLLCHLQKVFILMVGADSINKSTLYVRACFFGRPHRTFHIAGIVQRVKNTDDGNAVIDRAFHELSDNVISIMAVTQNILAAQQHLDRGFL